MLKTALRRRTGVPPAADAGVCDDDRNLGDAFKYLDYALKSWEKIIEKVGKGTYLPLD